MRVIKGSKIIEVTEKAYEVVYKSHGYKPYNATVDGPSKPSDDYYDDMTKALIGDVLDARGIEYSNRDNKAKLIKLLEAGE